MKVKWRSVAGEESAEAEVYKREACVEAGMGTDEVVDAATTTGWDSTLKTAPEMPQRQATCRPTPSPRRVICCQLTVTIIFCLSLIQSPSPRYRTRSRMPSSA